MTDRAGRDSRCCHPPAAPYQWLIAYDVENPAYRELEEWLSGLSPFAEQVERGEIDDLFEAASEGKLWDSGDALHQHIKVDAQDQSTQIEFAVSRYKRS